MAYLTAHVRANDPVVPEPERPADPAEEPPGPRPEPERPADPAEEQPTEPVPDPDRPVPVGPDFE